MSEFSFASLQRALTFLGELLSAKGLDYDVVAIGGGSLLLLGLIARPTMDLDLVARLEQGKLVSSLPLPEDFRNAISEVGRAFDLREDWVNSGPADLLPGLPKGFMDRVEKHIFGGLTLYLASRIDHIYLKLYASVDQGPHSKHFTDLKRLEPSLEELAAAADWCLSQDESEPFKADLLEALSELS